MTPRALLLSLAIGAGLAGAWPVRPGAQPADAAHVDLVVRETAGIRRTAYPVRATVGLRPGALSDASRARLTRDDRETPLQATVTRRWPDGSIRSLDVDFNTTMGALETARYRLEYGAAVSAAPVARGLAVSEEADAVQVGRIRLGRSGRPLLLSVKYRNEDIAEGPNGLQVKTRDGSIHDFGDASPISMDIVKRGPLLAAIRYSGVFALTGGFRAPFVLTVEMPGSKSWIRIEATVEDPERKIEEIGWLTPLALGPLPWMWDIGTDRGTYGALRRAGDAVAFAQDVRSTGRATWDVRGASADGSATILETTGPRQAAPARWLHLQSATEAVAFAIETAGEPGTGLRVSLGADGRTSIGVARGGGSTRHHLVLYEHFVSTPLAIGAATSPASALAPLAVSVEEP